MDYIPGTMREQDRLEWKLKAEAFDRLIAKYRSLENHDGFYSRNWLELTDHLDKELKHLQQVLVAEIDPSGSS